MKHNFKGQGSCMSGQEPVESLHMPLIRRATPSLVAEDIIGVHPPPTEANELSEALKALLMEEVTGERDET